MFAPPSRRCVAVASSYLSLMIRKHERPCPLQSDRARFSRHPPTFERFCVL